MFSLPLLPIQELMKIQQSPQARSECEEFVGTPRKHPTDETRLILVTQVLENQRVFLEFKKEDIRYVDEGQTVINSHGESIQLVSVWVKKNSIGIELKPFRV